MYILLLKYSVVGPSFLKTNSYSMEVIYLVIFDPDTSTINYIYFYIVSKFGFSFFLWYTISQNSTITNAPAYILVFG